MEVSIGGGLGLEIRDQISLGTGDQSNGQGSGGEANQVAAGVHLGSNHDALGAGLHLSTGGHLGAAKIQT